ncbi:acetylxylan esterase [Streptomyces sp. NBC_00257]|uniref:acetylxylan esterase n=1 Tax=unclassified Streptomyces TaxID=2593676 RepID=UPI0022554C1B|nr:MULTISPECIES: acetylxylan esterase [unclassified Streptomyces]MCX4864734.1 acetylxylan esterase [Streptomyces sp. NBC_00906]MCX4895972.1 acetylxylan esterase [Streptomyces sp. NBC_00892]MCX5429262.1 acetylxylan esterase [Streptomyces sp. NBC_00062]
MASFEHDFPFDPAYGYELQDLLRVPAPAAPDDFDAFWRERHQEARKVATEPELGPLEEERDGVRIHGVTFTSVGGVRIGGWVALPVEGAAEYGFVIGHGYGGREQPGPDVPLPLPRAAAILPCVRGMKSRGLHPGIPDVSAAHVLHGIESRDTYVIGGCVADLWCAASALHELVPELAPERGGPALGYLGESFGGGLGALALPWDDRFGAGQLTVPTFGNHPLRLTLPCIGSGESVRAHHRDHPEVTGVLPYFDAVTAATRLEVPTLVAAALFDPSVPPPGQFAVHNALAGEHELLVLSAGHFEHEGTAAEVAELRAARQRFFGERLGRAR